MFEILEHTADIGFRATAETPEQLFETAAVALVNIAMNTGDVIPRESIELTAEGDSIESLLVNWLSEVLYCLDGEGLALSKFKVRELTANRAAGYCPAATAAWAPFLYNETDPKKEWRLSACPRVPFFLAQFSPLLALYKFERICA